MTLLVEGFKYRTSGPGAPFDSFANTYEDPGAIWGKEEPLPLPETSFLIEEIGDAGIRILLRQEGNEPIRFVLEDEKTIRLQRGILGIEVRFRLS